jgi:glycosyltransferase involved in cell wall biosynthesis
MTSTRPLAVWKQFLRAGFVADRCVRTGVTLLHGHFANAPTQVAWFASAMTGIPYSFTAHAKDLYLTAPHIIRRHVRGAAFVTTCTGFNADFLRGMVPERDRGKVRLVYHGIDLARLTQRASSGPALMGGAPLILCVGRLVPKKGLNDLLAACQILHQEGIRFRCMIVGEGPLRSSLEADIERRDLGGLVVLTGAMTHAKLIEIYRKADLFALPSRVIADGDRDGIPNVIAEAMAIGVPVISTSISGIPEIIENGVTGLLVEPESPIQLAAALRDLLGDPELGAALARQARARLAQDFDCHETTKALRDLMHECACGHSGDSPGAAGRSAAGPRHAPQLAG